MPTSTGYEAFVMAMERVEQRLKQVAAALDKAGIPYAVVGGNAVAAWVATVDPAATRTTKDVDLLVRRGDLDRITKALTNQGYQPPLGRASRMGGREGAAVVSPSDAGRGRGGA